MRSACPLRLTPLIPVLFAMLVAGLLSCSKKTTTYKPDYSNHPPVVSRISFSPTRIHAHQRIRVIATANDPDGDRLTYRWKTSRGSFPQGNGSLDVNWQTPDSAGTDTLTVKVSDLLHDVTEIAVVTEVGLAPPDSMGFVNGPSSAVVQWGRSADDPLRASMDTTGYSWRGYEVFCATRSFTEIPPESVINYRITSPSVLGVFLRVTDLQRGTRYWFRVSARRAWEQVIQKSPPTQEIDLAPRPEGTFEVAEAGAAVWALDLSAGSFSSVDPADPTDLDQRDVYFGTSDPLDGPGALRLKSVSLLANRNPEWGTRSIQIQVAGQDWHIGTVPGDAWSEQADVAIGDVYILRLPEGNYAKLQVTNVRGTYPYRRILLRWAYQTIPNYANF